VNPTLSRVTDQASRQAFWRGWLAEHLEPALARRLSGVVERDGALVLFAQSAVWSARLRYAVRDLELQIRATHPDITRITVRVLPKT